MDIVNFSGGKIFSGLMNWKWGKVIYCLSILIILLSVKGFFRDLEIARPKEHDLSAKIKLPVISRNYAN